MIWLRKGFVLLLSGLLLLALLATAQSTSTNIALSHPSKIKNWLDQSKLYDHFVANIITQAQKSAGNNIGTSSISSSTPDVDQAAKSAFSPQLLHESVNTFVDSNYAWLQGKTAQPEFTIDLSAAKQSFARHVGQYAQTHVAGLPICNNIQLAQIQNPANAGPLALTCRPPNLSPAAAGALVTQKIASSSDFLSTPIITPQTFSPKDSGGQPSQPYYQKLAKAPQVYRLGQKLPYIFGALALLLTLSIILIAPRRRYGVRRVGWVLLVAGLLLVAGRFISDYVFKKVEHRVFTAPNAGPIQQSLLDFGHRVQHQIIHTNLYFAGAFIVLAILIFLILLATRRRTAKPIKSTGPTTAESGSATSTSADASTIQLAPRRSQPPPRNIIVGPPPVAPDTKPPTTEAQKPNQPPRPKRPRLIQ